MPNCLTEMQSSAKEVLQVPFLRTWPWVRMLSPSSEPLSSGKFTLGPHHLLANCFPRLSSLSLSHKWRWRTNLVPNALLLIAPYVTHSGHGNFGFCLCVFREGNGKKPTEEETRDEGSPVLDACGCSLHPSRSRDMQKGAGYQDPPQFTSLVHSIIWLNGYIVV